MKKSEILLTIIIIIATLFGDYQAYDLMERGFPAEEQHCGTVVYKSTEEIECKSGSTNNLYLGIEFEGLGRHAIYMSDIDKYITSKVGDNVCVNVRPRQVGLPENMVWDVLRASLAFLACIATLGFAGMGISRLFLIISKAIDNEN